MVDLPPVLAHLIEMLALGGMSLLGLGAGLRVLGLLGVAGLLSAGERLLFGLALGYGALAFLMLAVGLLGVLYLPVGLALLAGLGLLSVGPLLAFAPEAREMVRRVQEGLRYPPNLFLAGVIVVSVGSALVKALVPVVTQDDLMYHLALPRRYVEAHSVGFYPDSTYSLFPQLMEMLYTWGLLLGSDRLAVLFALAVSLIGPAGAALFAARNLRPGNEGSWRVLPLLTAAVFLSTPLVLYVLRAANTDIAQASFDLLAVYAFYLAVRDAKINSQLLALSGLCCGLSFSVKYYGFAIPLALGGALLAVLLFRRGSVIKSTRAVGAFVLPAVLLAAPWLLRNIVESGNPVWPLGGALLGGAYWSREASPETLLGRAPGLSPANLWTGIEFIWSGVTRGPLSIDAHEHVVSLGPLLLPLVLLLPLALWRPGLRWVAYAAGAYWLLWALFFSRTSIRYLSTFFLLAAVLGAYSMVSLAARAGLLRRVLGGVLGLVLGLLAVEAALSTGTYLPTVLALDRAAEEQYLAAHLEDYPMMRYIRESLPPDARVSVWDGQPRGYYIERPYVYGRLVPLYTGFGSAPDAWRARFRELGITHVLVHERDVLAPGQAPGVDPLAPAAQSFANLYFTPELFRVGDYALYGLR